MLSRFRWRTPVYQNTGSVARDHLASERTFLAWIRTGLGFVALGIAIERFSQLDLRKFFNLETSEAIAFVMKATSTTRNSPTPSLACSWELGSGSIVYGTARYFSNLRLLEQGKFKPAYHGAAILAASVAGLAGGVYGSALRRSLKDRAEMRSQGSH